MQSHARILLLLLFCLSSLQLQAQDQEWKKLYDAHSCFALREKVATPATPALYRAISSCNFREASCHDRLLALEQGPSKADAHEATEWLAQDAFAEGQYSEALMHVKHLVKQHPQDKDAANAQALFTALASLGDQKLISRKEMKIPSVLFDGNVGTHVQINGRDAAFLFDTGANVSMMSEGQARALGLQIQEMKAKVGVVTGDQVTFRVAGAAHLRLGGVELEHVAFLIAPDSAEPFVDLPEGKRGILGLPVLLAAETLHYDGNTFDIGYKPAEYHRDAANLCAYGPTLNLELRHDQQSLIFALDTGAIHTDLYSTFASEFPRIAANARKESFTQKGVASSRKNDVLVVPSIAFDLAGSHVTLSPARIFMKPTVANNSEVLSGNLGMDTLGQTGGWAIDFSSMTLSLRHSSPRN